jgi:hypothetical protein
VYIFDFTPPGGGGYDRKGIWGKNMKKVKRKEKEKKKKEEKREKKKNGDKFNKQQLIFLLPVSRLPI